MNRLPNRYQAVDIPVKNQLLIKGGLLRGLGPYT